MHYQWDDYRECYRDIVETWFDCEAVKYTGCDDGWEQFYEYWKGEPETVLNENFFAKVVLDDGKAVSVMALFLEKDQYFIQEFVVSLDRRNMGIGSSILKELLENGECIIGKAATKAEACIYPSNVASIKAFEKAGFRYSHSHPDGDAWYYTICLSLDASGQDSRVLVTESEEC